MRSNQCTWARFPLINPRFLQFLQSLCIRSRITPPLFRDVAVEMMVVLHCWCKYLSYSLAKISKSVIGYIRTVLWERRVRWGTNLVFSDTFVVDAREMGCGHNRKSQPWNVFSAVWWINLIYFLLGKICKKPITKKNHKIKVFSSKHKRKVTTVSVYFAESHPRKVVICIIPTKINAINKISFE